MQNLKFTLLPIALILSAIFLTSQTTQANWDLDIDPPTPAISITCGATTFTTGNSSQNKCAAGITTSIPISCSEDPNTGFSSGCQSITYSKDGETPILPCDTCGTGANACATATACGTNLTGTCNRTVLAAGGACTTVTGASCDVSSKSCSAGQNCISNSCVANLSPWIQTTGGDVHSNTNINVPGGP